MIIHYKFYSIHTCTVWINYKTNTYVPVPITQLQKQIISEWQNPPCSPPQSHLLPLPEVTSVIFHALLFCMVLQHITASIYCIILHVVQLYINIFFHEKNNVLLIVTITCQLAITSKSVVLFLHVMTSHSKIIHLIAQLYHLALSLPHTVSSVIPEPKSSFTALLANIQALVCCRRINPKNTSDSKSNSACP